MDKSNEPEAQPSQSQQPQQKVISVQAMEEGPRIRPKRQMTEAQLEILKKGREKLAEKRRLMKEEALIQQQSEPQATEKIHEERESEQSEQQDQQQEPDESYEGGPLYCTVQ